jgi:hypothetical protein
VQVTRTDNPVPYNIIQNGISTLSGYQDFLNPLDSVTTAEFEASLKAIEKQITTIITLNAGSEYDAFNPNPTSYHLNAMGIKTDAKYAT